MSWKQLEFLTNGKIYGKIYGMRRRNKYMGTGERKKKQSRLLKELKINKNK